MKSLFKPFVQLDSALSREFEGSGLGLSLVAKMVELHGGSIEVQSQLGEGSRFIVAMPSKNPDIIEYEEDLDYDISCMQDRTVIVITESQSDYNVISNVLHERTAHIYRFDDDSKGINDVMEIQPHLIIIDSTIKHRSAWEIMAILKNDFRTKDIKIIMASMGKELEKASVVGADAFIGKPITANKVRKALCETYGVQFMDARNGQEAIEWVHEHRPDLILMDIQMPKMNGFEAIEFLKTSDEFRDIPIIALTALAMPGDRKKILDAGANDYLSKPISMIVLIERIQSYLKSR
jgi:CheY-like chemotaxis protein